MALQRRLERFVYVFSELCNAFYISPETINLLGIPDEITKGMSAWASCGGEHFWILDFCVYLKKEINACAGLCSDCAWIHCEYQGSN